MRCTRPAWNRCEKRRHLRRMPVACLRSTLTVCVRAGHVLWGRGSGGPRRGRRVLRNTLHGDHFPVAQRNLEEVKGVHADKSFRHVHAAITAVNRDLGSTIYRDTERSKCVAIGYRRLSVHRRWLHVVVTKLNRSPEVENNPALESRTLALDCAETADGKR